MNPEELGASVARFVKRAKLTDLGLPQGLLDTARDVAAASLGVSLLPTAVAAGRGTYDHARQAIWDWKNPIARGRASPGSYKPQIGDVVLSASKKEIQNPSIFDRLQNLLSGHPVRDHATILLPDAEGALRPTSTVLLGGQARRYPRISYLLKRLTQKGKPLRERFPTFQELNRIRDRMARQQPKVQDLSGLAKEVGDFGTLQGNSKSQVHEIYRLKQPLTAAEQQKVQANVMRHSGYAVDEVSMPITGARNLVTGRHSVLPQTGPKPPGTCAGGVAQAMEGIRDLGNQGSLLPHDIASNPHYERVQVRGPNKLMPTRGRVARIGAGGALARAATTAGLLALSSYGMSQINNGMG